MKRTALFGVLVAALMATTTPAPAGAETVDKLANLTFSGPVQVPGAILNAGTYRFRMANPETSRNIVQVLNHDGSFVFATFFTMPDMRMEVTDDPVVTYKETPAGVPKVIRSLFYGGEHGGYEFLYYGNNPIMTAPVTPQPPITYTRIAPAAEPAPFAAPAPAFTPAPAPAPLVTEPAAPLAPALGEEEVTWEAEELPATASPLPMVALAGFASLVLGLGAALMRRSFV